MSYTTFAFNPVHAFDVADTVTPARRLVSAPPRPRGSGTGAEDAKNGAVRRVARERSKRRNEVTPKGIFVGIL